MKQTFYLGERVMVQGIKEGYIVGAWYKNIYDVPGGRKTIRYGINWDKDKANILFSVTHEQVQKLVDVEDASLVKGYN